MSLKKKPIILTLTPFYLPGYRGGGPIRSIANMVDRLSDDYQFLILTSDRDFDDNVPYPNVKVNAWNQVGNAKVFYASPSMRNIFGITRLLRETEYDLLYLNSFFSVPFTIFPLIVKWISLIGNKATVVAPRGEFSEGALKLKSRKKSYFIKLARLMGLYNNVTWHASTAYERADIQIVMTDKVLPEVAGNISVAADLTDMNNSGLKIAVDEKVESSHHLKVCFLSRLSPKKNLDFALSVLARVSVPVQFTIYGPQEDLVYWDRCVKLINQLPAHIIVIYAGSVPHEHVHASLAKHDLFFLPTHGENYGHVFIESWFAGLPVLISDQTPWRDLEKRQLGWDLSLDAPDEFVRALEMAAGFDNIKWERVRQSCIQFAIEQKIGAEALVLNRNLFAGALAAVAP
ncbi:MAG: glycosyl transferase group 1 [Polaromonas sp.]|nr:glycosyl transferase group 1 [Polaromonas sp.]